MHIPGFTAEAALSRRSQPFQMSGGEEAPGGGARIAPQACVSVGPCRVCVDFRPFPPRACFSIRCPLGIGFSRCIP